MPVAARILNVDDNDGARYVKTRIMQVAGFDVIEAATGGEALSMVKTASPDLVLLDVKLPDINGLEVCRRIKADPATASVLVLQTSAALIHRADKVKALEGGADSYLVAPIEPEELVANINALLRLRRTRQDLAASEERFRQMAENINDVFWIFSPQDPGGFYVSPAFEAMWGRPAAGIAADPYDWLNAVHRHDRAQVREAFDRLLGGAPYEEEFRVVHPDGRIVWVRDRGFPVKNAAPGMQRIARITSDISVRKMAEKLRQEADSRKDEFLATLAHELRNPLGPIRTAVELMNLVDPSSTAVHQDARNIISRQVDHLVHLVNDLLDISRISQGKITLQLARVELRSFLSAAIETATPFINDRRHELEVSLPEEEMWVKGDSVRLAQAVGNLLHNAAKYTPTGGKIRLAAMETGGQLQISITDSGIGIDTDTLESIFDLFTQGDVAPDRAQDGLGIGLALVKKMIELHGGRVYAMSSGRGQGSTFNIFLPLSHDQTAHPDTASDALVPGLHSRRKVLLVDDNADSLTMIRALLEAHGFEVASAEDGLTALTLAQHFEPDAVVLDIGLPGISGYEVAKRLRAMERFRSIRIVAVSGYGQQRDRDMAIEAGFDDHMVKPVALQKLLEFIVPSA